MQLKWLKRRYHFGAKVKQRKNNKFQYYDASVLDCTYEPCPQCKFCKGWYKPKDDPANIVIRCKLETT